MPIASSIHKVERTRDRPLAAGRVRPREALVLFVALALSAFTLVLFMNRLAILLSFVGAALAASYPFMKRWTHLPQFYLGAAFGWGVPMAFAAQTGSVPADAWILFGATLCWAVAYDTAYAMVDRDDDIRIGVKSTAILFGHADRLMIALFHALTLALLAWAGARAGLGLTYYMGLLLAAGLAGWQQWLMRTRSRDGCFRAFLNNNRFGAVIFAGLALDSPAEDSDMKLYGSLSLTSLMCARCAWCSWKKVWPMTWSWKARPMPPAMWCVSIRCAPFRCWSATMVRCSSIRR